MKSTCLGAGRTSSLTLALATTLTFHTPSLFTRSSSSCMCVTYYTYFQPWCRVLAPTTGPSGCSDPTTLTLASLEKTIPKPYFAKGPTRILAESKAFIYSPSDKATFRVPFRSLGPAYRRGRRKAKLSFSDRKYRRDRRNRLPDRLIPIAIFPNKYSIFLRTFILKLHQLLAFYL